VKNFLLLCCLCFGLLIHSPIESMAQWVQTNKPFYVGINSFFVQDTNLFVGTWYGAYRLTYNDTRWVDISNSTMRSEEVRTFGVIDSTLLLLVPNGIYSSTDCGTIWHTIADPISTNPSTYVTTLLVNDSNLFAGTGSSGIFISTDRGSRWTPINSGLADLNITCLAARGNTLYAGTWMGGFYRSTNNGLSWTLINTSWETNPAATTILISDSNLYVGSGGSGVFRSTDSGASWNCMNLHLKYNSPEDLNVNTLAKVGSNLFVGTNNGVYLTRDNGANWIAANTGLTNPCIKSLAIIDTNLYAGTAGSGVFLSTDYGSSWNAINNGFKIAPVSALTHKDNLLFSGTDGGGVFLSTDNGGGWTACNWSLSNNYVVAFAATSSFLFVGTGGGGGVLRSSYGDYHWGCVDSGLPSPPWIRALSFIDSHLFVGTNYGVFLSTNNGDSWSESDFGLPANPVVTALSADAGNLFATVDGHGIFLSTNYGTTWTAIDIDSTGAHVNALAVSNTNLFAGTDNGVFLGSTDIMTGWSKVNDGLIDHGVLSLNLTTKSLFAGTVGGGVWKRPLSEMVTGIETKSNGTPGKFALEQNYPNPFNPSTIIAYQLPTNSFTSIKVYDILGREVKTLVNEHIYAGRHTITFNAPDLPSGVYFYRVEAGTYHDTKKLLLLK
jgi:photosystem II stability/assembly factor-like uncharacterized protein